MVADTSAIIAILTDEPERQSFSETMSTDGEALVSTANAVEVLMAATGKGDDIYQAAVEFFNESFIQLVPLDGEQVGAASDASRRYGKGRHPAGLNFGDTFAYALASTRSLPLLFKGNDFSRTDIPTAGSSIATGP